ncbi:hypothetical protein HG537_0D04090 [Torulaspora globosa]|uniref:Uncharacterized protein n=1 Tax=Torulaspora globosa TaxID=48254 RepID=A0A7H9HRN2_9SACH|nr:hypothetical protein HG537_0D04090 [Torulaspora sp. CBS 2947]
MQPLTLTVYDRNVRHSLSESHRSNSQRTPDGGSHAIFPTNFHYIFEDDNETEELKTDGSVENVIILHMEESGSVSHAELISDQYELLSFNSGSTGPGNDEGQDIELEVVSQFNDLTPLVRDLTLVELIKLYTTQNEQLQTISNSM